MNRFALFTLSFVCLILNVVANVAVNADTIEPVEFDVADGFEVSVWATTPQLYNPTNFDVDSKGRIWVTESVNYREFRNAELGVGNKEGDRIVVLQDTDNDGKADSSHTFVRDTGLVAPLGIGVIDNQIIVSCAPSITIYTDVDRNLKFDPAVDKKETFLTGFRGLDHDHSLHGVKAGPDGYWYFNVGNAGPHTVTDKSGWTLRAGSSYAGGSPHLKKNFPGRKSDDGRVWVGGVALRVLPDGTGLEPIGHNFRNVYEEAVSSFGDVFHADNDDPPACRTSWLMEYGNAGFASADGSRTWKVDQRPSQPVSVAEWRQEDPGTMPAGDVYGFGAPTGVAFGENGCFDSKYKNGLLLVCESARGEVFSYEPKVQGAGFSLERSVFLKLKKGSPKQGWFRPSDVMIGADGAIYISDWYDPGVGGHRMTDKTASGTIYRIAPKGFQPTNAELDLTTQAGRAAALLSPAVNVRNLGWKAIKDRGADGFPEISKLLENPNPMLCARSIWLLPYAGERGFNALSGILSNEDAPFRITALRALKRAAASDKALGKTLEPILNKALTMLCDDSSSAVRREVALSLRDLPWEQREKLLPKLAAGFDGWDRWYLEAIGIACESHEDAAYKLLVQESGVKPLQWDRRLASLAWRLHPASATKAITQRAMSSELTEFERKQMLTALAFIPDQSAAQGMLRVALNGPDDVKGMAAWWGKNRDKNDWKSFAMGSDFPNPPKFKQPDKKAHLRLDYQLDGEPVFSEQGSEVAIKVDVTGARRLYLVVDRIAPDEENKPSKVQSKPPTTLKKVRAAWVSPKLSGDSGSLDLMTAQWAEAFCSGQEFYPADAKHKQPWDRRLALNAPTFNRKESSLEVQTRSIVCYDIGGKYNEFLARGIVDQDDAKAGHNVRFSVFLDHSQTGDAIPPVASLVDMKGNSTLGRALFFSKRVGCSGCHSASGFGGGVGPDLTEIAKKHAPPVLAEGVINPSAAISMGFETMQVLTLEGEVISGLVVSAGDPVVLKDSNGKIHTIPQDEVDDMKSSKLSMMPDLKDQLTAKEVASILAFLNEMKIN